MRIIEPIAIDPGTPLLEYGSLSLDFIEQVYAVADPLGDPTALINTNVPEDDYDVWAAGSFDEGDRVLFEHKVYEALSTTTAQPDVGAVADPPSWLCVGVANRWKMFDEIISTQTTNPAIISVTIDPGAIVNALALFGLSGSEVTVTMNDSVEGVVFNETRPLQDNTAVTNWYGYFFEEIVQIEEAVFLDLPSYGTATVDISIVAGSETAKCGELVLGKQRELGVANFGTSVGIQSYSVKTTDDFGNTVITPRAFAKRADYDVSIDTNKIAGVQKLLASIRDVPIVYIGDEDRPETIVYGFYRNFDIVLSTPSISDCSLEVEGLV